MTDARPLRVALVGPPLDASGGIGRVMGYALSALPADDVRVEVLDTRGRSGNPLLSALPLMATCGTLLARAIRGRADLVHVNISSHGSAIRKAIVVRACRLYGLPVVLHLHASSFPEFFDPLPGWAQRWVRRTFAMATSVLVLSDGWRSYVCDVLTVPPERVAVLPNATPAARRVGEPRSSDTALRVVFLGRLGPRKGVPELLAALADPRMGTRSWTATLAGDGDVTAYRAEAVGLGLEGRIDFPGWLGPEEVTALLGRAHVLVLPSHAEGLPMSVLESFSAGVPVVSTPAGGLAEVVRHEENGLLIAPGDVAGLVDALVRLHDDEPLRARLASAARDTWRRAHSIDQYAVRIAATWHAAAGRPAARVPSASVASKVGA
jgi:glycosyltransferase involved in cell wall biosynthesis